MEHQDLDMYRSTEVTQAVVIRTPSIQDPAIRIPVIQVLAIRYPVDIQVHIPVDIRIQLEEDQAIHRTVPICWALVMADTVDLEETVASPRITVTTVTIITVIETTDLDTTKIRVQKDCHDPQTFVMALVGTVDTIK